MLRSMIKKALGFEAPSKDSGTQSTSPGTPAKATGGGLVQMGKKPGTAPREGLPLRPRDQDVAEWAEDVTTQNKVVVFMKGTPSAPACGFSAQVAQVFKQSGVPFQTYNILEDSDVREGIKKINNWPTIPQIFINGEFIGGCDITMQMNASGELAKLLKPVASPSADESATDGS